MLCLYVDVDKGHISLGVVEQIFPDKIGERFPCLQIKLMNFARLGHTFTLGLKWAQENILIFTFWIVLNVRGESGFNVRKHYNRTV